MTRTDFDMWVYVCEASEAHLRSVPHIADDRVIKVLGSDEA
jgi:hypothetical protein